MADILVLQHIACETPGRITEALQSSSLGIKIVNTGAGESVPRHLGDAAGLLVMGGPMGVYEQERYPFLKQEMALIEKAVAAELPVLGICLGSQLLAHTLGAKVFKGPQKEIGWYPVSLTEAAGEDALWSDSPKKFTAFHWHGDQFDLPQGAELLAASDLTPHQAFRFGARAYGLLFHLEVTAVMIRSWVETFAEELTGAGLSGEAILKEMPSRLPALEYAGDTIFEAWASLARTAGKQS